MWVFVYSGYMLCVFRSDAVISWAAKLLPQSLFVIYEQIHPYDPFGRIMQDHFLKLNSTLHALRQYPDTAAQRHRFLDKASMQTLINTGFYLLFPQWSGPLRAVLLCCCVQGWEQCVCLDMNVFYLGLVPEEERCRVENLEPFDEYEVSC